MNFNLKSQARLVLLATAAVSALAIGGMAAAADAIPAPSTFVSGSGARDGSITGRIAHLHNMLKITPAQEVQWKGVAQVMQENAMSMDSAIKDREAKAKEMSAVDDLMSFQAITAAHAEGLKKFADAFAPLYAAMSPEQQKNADAVFRHRTESASRRTSVHG